MLRFPSSRHCWPEHRPRRTARPRPVFGREGRPSGNRLWRFGEARRATFWRHSKLCIIEPAAIGLRAVASTMPRWRDISITGSPSGAPSHRKPRFHVPQQILNVTEAQGEPDIKPDRLLDNLGREAVAAITDAGHPRWLRLKVTDGKPNGDVTMPS
jgi:hypothetical protein